MSLIKLSTVSVAYLLGGDKSSSANTGPFGSSNFTAPYGYNGTVNTKLRIYKGSLPTTNDIETIAPSSLRTTDLLITFHFSTGNAFTVSTSSTIIETTVPLPTAATGSGTASWFLLSSYDTLTGAQCLVGEITLPGGGGELVINDLNIVSGTTYSLGSLSFKFPSTFSYP